MATKKIKQLEKILIAVGIALLAVVIICIVVFSRADKVSAPEAIPVLTTTTTTTTTTTVRRSFSTRTCHAY